MSPDRPDAELPREGAPAGFGRVISVRGSRATLGLAVVPEEQTPVTVGSFVGIRRHRRKIICMITEVSRGPAPGLEGTGFGATAEVDLLGELVEEDPTGADRFRRGVRSHPAIGDAAEPICGAELMAIFAASGPHRMRIGSLHQDEDVPILLNAEQMLAKHFAVLGATGVGKSSTTGVLLRELVGALPELRVLLLDVHNEYGPTFPEQATEIGGDTLKLPFWLFNFEEMIDVIYGGKPAVPEEVEILAELIPAAKATYSSHSGGDRPLIERRRPRATGFTADTPSPYMLQDLVALIDERMGKLENRSSRMNHHRLMARIDAIKSDPRYTFMFKNANVGGDSMAQVLTQLFGLEEGARPITILKLASLPDEAIDAVVCIVARLSFEFALWSDGALPLLLVCEEAHRYASADGATGFAPARRALKRIAREGRKYGVNLGLVSQRPSEIHPTILSQCGTFFVLRMINDQDQMLLRSAASDAAATLLDVVPALGAQEIVGFGEGMPLPTRFTVSSLAAGLLPHSDMGSRAGFDADGSHAEIVRRTIERWRSATTGSGQEGVATASAITRQGLPQSLPQGGSQSAHTLAQTPLELGLRSLSDTQFSPSLRSGGPTSRS